MARLVIKDLIEFDAVKIELAQTKLLLVEVEKKVDLQGDAINLLSDKVDNFESILAIRDEQFVLQRDISSDLQKSLRREKRKSKFFTITTVAAVVLAGLSLTK